MLIGGVVLLTLKKPEPKPKAANGGGANSGRTTRRYTRDTPKREEEDDEREDDEISLTERGDAAGGSKPLSWQVGDDSDDEDMDHTKPPLSHATEAESSQRRTLPPDAPIEARGLMSRADEADDNDYGEFTTATHSR